MKVHRTAQPPAVVISLVLVLVSAIGMTSCGDQGETGSSREGVPTTVGYNLAVFQPESVRAKGSPAFNDFLRTLRRTAFSGRPEHAARLAKKLKAAEKAVGEEFCEFTYLVKENRELKYLDRPRYSADRIIRYAAYRRGPAFTAEAQAALKQLDAVIDLESFDPDRVRRYRIACFK